jgi:DNA-binding LacI/PurR family transcriptional regulator
MDMAREAGVSCTTVSRVLNDKVRPETREDVLLAVTRLGHAGICARLALPHPPTATFASKDISGLGMMKALHKQSPHIPYSLPGAGLDSIPRASI